MRFSGMYADYYDKFRKAIKAKYPDMNVIMSMYWGGLNRPVLQRATDAKIDIDMVDEHAYHPDDFARTNFNYFDRYDRSVPWKLFVGEHASQRGHGDWGGGMGDSLYMMMVERNGDLVKMAAYAPLFVNVQDRTWPYNLIEYDAARSFAHASYYVQQTFNANRPDVNLETTTDYGPKPTPTATPTPMTAANGTTATGTRRGRGGRGGRGRGANPELPWFFATSGYDKKKQEVVVKATNYQTTAVPMEIKLDGAAKVEKTGKLISISGPNLITDNTLENPKTIAPKEQAVTDCAEKFTVMLPPLSVNVLRIPAK